MPALAAARGWPVRHDHCFQRILLDAACGGKWTDHVAGRPAYRFAESSILERAIELGEKVIAGDTNLGLLNARSLHWRGKGMRDRKEL